MARVPALNLATVAHAGREESLQCEELSHSNALENFADFWDNCDHDAGQTDTGIQQATETVAIGTPRLQIFQLTPRERAAPESDPPERGFVPFWPFSSRWPFCRAPTTLELHNLPPSLTVEMLCAHLDRQGFSGKYDFAHVPTTDSGSGSSVFATLNAVRHADGCAIASCVHGLESWDGCPSSEPCRVSWSFTCQGIEELVNKHQNLCAWSQDGSYAGAWVRSGGMWMPVVQPVWVPIMFVMPQGPSLGNEDAHFSQQACAWRPEAEVA
eukprot:TRINITY_DN21016_c0_g1_i1.p1 TRINITY_DN21016_c0_g1~~TRINITY_DN21016_c0_g1_i1.p1  ORF type:complete len:279 (+),score=40.39 TRINITY_DN21016_c0_g1_i1:31-837(+)